MDSVTVTEAGCGLCDTGAGRMSILWSSMEEVFVRSVAIIVSMTWSTLAVSLMVVSFSVVWDPHLPPTP